MSGRKTVTRHTEFIKHSQRGREIEIINRLFVCAVGTKAGFFRAPLTRAMVGEALKRDWRIGMLNCRCVEPLPSLLPRVTNKKKRKTVSTCTETHIHTLAFNHCKLVLLFLSSPIQVSGKGIWTVFHGCLASFSFTLTNDSCPDMPSVSLAPYLLPLPKECFCFLFFFVFHFYPDFAQYLRPQDLLLCVLVQISIIR